MTACRPFVKWAGGKTQLLPELLARMPPRYGRFFEPFLGGGALFFALRPQRAWLADANEELMNAFCVVRDDVEALIEDLQQHVYEKEYYYALRNVDRTAAFASWSPVQRAGRFLYLNKTCFNGLYRVNSRGQFNTPFGRYKNPTICDAPLLRACSRALQGTELRCAEFLAVEEEARAGDFVYFDPPYAPLSKTAHFTSYNPAGFDTTRQHDLKALCERLDAKGVLFMLSNSFTELAMDLYKDFRVEVLHATRAINTRGAGRGKINELVVTNYAPRSPGL